MPEVITDNLDLWTSAMLTKSTAGRGSNGKLEAYGIKKLRGLILELAVCGKLVVQNPNDKPASVLLKNITKEKAQLIKKGKIKKQGPLLEISEDEKPFELPVGWEWVRFGTIAQHNSGKTLDSGRNTGQLRDYITTSNLYWGRFDLDNIRQMPIRDDELEKCTARKGDLLICEGGEAGRAAVWPYDHDVCFQNHVHRARVYGEIDPYYVYRYFEKLNATGEIDLHRKGVGISNMSSKALALIVLPLPPLEEQHRIVAKVDELMALCDQLEQQQTQSIEAHQKLVEILLGTLTRVESRQELSEALTRIASHFDILFTTEQSIDQLKQIILQLAVMGKLVPQDPSDEPASALIENIAKEKKLLIKEGMIKKQEPLTEISDDEKPFDLPPGWTWTRLGNLSSNIHYGYTASAIHRGDGIRLLRITDIQNDAVNWEAVPGCDIEDDKAKDFLLENDDILIARTGGTIGKSYLVENIDVEAVFASYLIRVKRIDGVYSSFIKTFLGSQVYWHQLYANSMGTGQPNVNATALKGLVFPIPPLSEQYRIVAKVDELMALCDALKARLADAQAIQIHLADAIVEQAVA